MDEETVKPCIQDKVRHFSAEIQWQFIMIMFCIVGIFAIYLFSLKMGQQFEPMEIIIILSTLGTLGLGLNQYLINATLLKIQQHQGQPFLYAKIDGKYIIVENSGGGIAWKCKILVQNFVTDEEFTLKFDKIYPRVKEIIDIEISSAKAVIGVDRMVKYIPWDLTIENIIKITIIYHIDEAGIEQKDWVNDFKLPGGPDKSYPRAVSL